MILALTIIHIVIAVVLILTVLLQHGKQQGLSGAIAGGAETFFGKNKGRTIDAMLKKLTAVFAVLFIVSSLALAALSAAEYKADIEATEITETADTTDAAADQQVEVSVDEEGNLVDAEGNIVMTAEQMAEQEAAAAAEGEEAPAEGETAPAEGETTETPAE